ncbi:MAG: hypothetical protein AB4352_23955 [Hormoscilla sp.]
MKLKPGLFQIIVVVAISSLVVACNPYSPSRNRSNCNDRTVRRSDDCDPPERSGESVFFPPSGGRAPASVGRPGKSGESVFFAPSGGRAPGSVGRPGKTGTTTPSPPSAPRGGRGGFGSFGRGGASG